VKEYQALQQLFLDHLEHYRHTLTLKQPAELYGPENYILSLGGKRLRPLLALIACDLFGKDPLLAMDSALAVELFHNFSLIHDDILDGAPLRRNQPTVHEKWGTGIAILSGDVMLVKVFQALENYNDSEFKKLSRLLHHTAVQVCEGQQMDMNFESAKTLTVREYIHMITCKTAVLLGCSLKMGAICAGAAMEDQDRLYEFGIHIGISFQLLDDLLDAYSDPAKFGKQAGGDIIANKKTYLYLRAMELADAGHQEILEACLSEKNPQIKIKNMMLVYEQLHVASLCRTEAEKHTQMAMTLLDSLSIPGDKKELLKKFTSGLLQREN
jgi:geranylgeranyl diphosphate synthase type II